jgi:hypothetical protein
MGKGCGLPVCDTIRRNEMSESGYYETVVQALRGDPLMRSLGFRDGETDIRWYRKGGNRQDLMVITKPSWTVQSTSGKSEGYEGVNIHFESRGAGDLRVDCELTPRLGSEAKKNPTTIAPLLKLKGDLTGRLRMPFLRSLQHFGVNVERVQKNPSSPKSLKVVGFHLGLSSAHLPDDFAAQVSRVIAASSPIIDNVLRSRLSEDLPPSQSIAGPILPGTTPDRGPIILPPIISAAAFLERINKTRGMPERNMEDVVKRFLVLLGHDEHCIAFQIGHVDIRLANESGQASAIIEVKRVLYPGNQRSATDQAFGYAERAQAPTVVVTDSDLYEVYDRRRGASREDMFVGRFQLTRFHPGDERVLDSLRPEARNCAFCQVKIPGISRFCPKCGKDLHTS